MSFGLLLDVVRHHAVDADDRQHQRDGREAGDQDRQRSRPLQRLRHQLVDRRDAGKRQARIEIADDSAGRQAARRGVGAGPQQEERTRAGVCEPVPGSAV